MRRAVYFCKLRAISHVFNAKLLTPWHGNRRALLQFIFLFSVLKIAQSTKTHQFRPPSNDVNALGVHEIILKEYSATPEE